MRRRAGVPTVSFLGALGVALATILSLHPAPALEGKVAELVVADATARPPSLDPFKVYGTQAQSLFRLIYAPLVDRDPDGKLITPLLERWGQVDPLTWEFRLRQGTRFHDGAELTAADVAFSLKRILDPDLESPRRREFEELDTLVAVDRWTVRLTTKRPYALLPARLSQFSMVLPDRLRDRPVADFFRRPVGVGPFQLAEMTAGQAVLTAFPDYFAGAPKVSRVVFQFTADPAERLRQLLQGPVDIVTNLPPQQVEAVKRARNVRLLKRNSVRFMYIMLDTTRGVLARTEARQALQYGTDVEGLIKYVARGNGRPLATFALPEDFGFNPNLRPYPFAPAKARALLAQAGYPQGFRLQGLATDETRSLATAVARQWAKLGITLDVTVESRAAAIARWIRERGQNDLMFMDPTSIMFDAAFQLRVHLDPNHPICRSLQPRALELLNRADAERNPDARAGLLREIQAIVHDQALTIPLYHVVDLYGVRDRVRGFVPSADTILRLAGASLAP